MLGLALDDDTTALLVQAFDTRANGSVNYRLFCEELARVANASAGPSAAGAARLPDDQLYEALRARVRAFLQLRSDHVRDWFADYDRHHVGLVSAAQFRRAFLPRLSAAEHEALVRRFGQRKDGLTLMNYLAFDADVESAQTGARADADTDASAHASEAGQAASGAARAHTPDTLADRVLDRLRREITTHSIRISEAFVDYDTHRKGLISRAQFQSALGSNRLALTPAELEALCDRFAAPQDGRVEYRAFLDLIEAAFVPQGLETNPLGEVAVASRAEPTQHENALDAASEAALHTLLGSLRSEVSRRRMLLLPFFEAFDKHHRGRVSQSHFHRIIAAMGLSVTEADMLLLLRCYAVDSAPTFDVNYFAFLAAIDPEGVFATSRLFAEAQSDRARLTTRAPSSALRELRLAGVKAPAPAPDSETLLARISAECTARRLRIRPYFADYDPLRHGRISASQFRRALTLIVGDALLSDASFSALAAPYTDAATGLLDYDAFVRAVDQSDVARGERSARSLLMRDMNPVLARAPPALDARASALLETFLARMRERVRQRSELAAPVLRDFDRHHRGYISGRNAAQALAILGVAHSAEELDALLRWGSDERGDFNYGMLLAAVDPSPAPAPADEQRALVLASAAAGTGAGLANTFALARYEAADVPLAALMAKIRARVTTRRVRLSAFLHDSQFHTARLARAKFGAGLAAAGIALTASEIAALERAYVNAADADFVDHARFIADVEGNPDAGADPPPGEATEPVVYQPRGATPATAWAHGGDDPALLGAMHRMIEKVASRRMHLKPTFQDVDRHACGKISPSQFTAVLESFFQLSLAELQAVVRAFALDDGRVDYASFLRAVRA